MKTKFFILNVISIIFIFSANSQTFIPKGKTQLIEFSNTSTKFIVPEGKSWIIYNVFSDYGADPKTSKYLPVIATDNIYIFLKNINGIEKNDLSKNQFGTLFFSSKNNNEAIRMPLVLPEKTSFELSLIRLDINDEKYKLFDGVGYVSLIEIDN